MSTREIIEFLNLHAQRINNLVAKRDLPDDTAGHSYLVGQFESVVKRAVADLELLETKPIPDPFDVRGDQWLFGVDSELEILRGAQCTMTACSQIAIKVQRLCVPKSIGPHFLIHDFRVGRRSEVPNYKAKLPAEIFASNLPIEDLERIAQHRGFGVKLEEESGLAELLKDSTDGRRFDSDPCYPGMEFAMTVENIGPEPMRFVAGMVGIARDTR